MASYYFQFPGHPSWPMYPGHPSWPMFPGHPSWPMFSFCMKHQLYVQDIQCLHWFRSVERTLDTQCFHWLRYMYHMYTQDTQCFHSLCSISRTLAWSPNPREVLLIQECFVIKRREVYLPTLSTAWHDIPLWVTTFSPRQMASWRCFNGERQGCFLGGRSC